MRRLIALLAVILVVGCSQRATVPVTARLPTQTPSFESRPTALPTGATLPQQMPSREPQPTALPTGTTLPQPIPSFEPKSTPSPASVTPSGWTELPLPSGCSFGAISPNFQWLAYTCSGSGWLARVKAGHLDNPVPTDADIWLSFTPDSSAVIGAWAKDDYTKVFSLSDTTRIQKIASGTLLMDGSIWSPDGSVMATCSKGCQVIYLLHPGDWTVEEIVDAPGRHDAQYGWSPDSQEMVYISGDGITGDQIMAAHIINRQSRKSRTLLEGKFILSSASWSPDGKWIAIHIEEPIGSDKHYLQLIDLQTGDKTKLAFDWPSDTRMYGWVLWSPDGRRLALDGEAMHIIEIPSGKVVFVQRGIATPLAWSADGTSLLVIGHDSAQNRDVLRWLSIKP